MIQVTNVSADPSQQIAVILADGTVAILTLTYRPAIERWSFNLEHPSIPPAGQIRGQNVCVSPNMLRAFRNVAEVGLACTASDGVDPFQITDFTPTANGVQPRCSLFVLDSTDDEDDVLAVEENVMGGRA